MPIMATPKNNKRGKGRPPNPEGQPPRRGMPVRIRHSYLDALQALVDRNGSDVPEEVNVAVRERLERTGFWPPPVAGQPSTRRKTPPPPRE